MGERPDGELLRHVLRIGPHDPQHVRRLEDRPIVGRRVAGRSFGLDLRGGFAHADMLPDSPSLP
jgi:hypothetical protein